MKVFSIALALTALASSAPLDAQILGSPRPSPSTTRGTSVDGSWRVVGRDGNGNTIYERRTLDGNGNIRVQRARRDANGNMSIISTSTVSNTNNRNGRNCDYTQSTNTVGDIIFGRSGNTNNVNCDDVGNRRDGGWYQVRRGRDNNSIYERRTRDSNGNMVIQRARRNPNGSFTILSTRYANDNDKQWRKAQKKQDKEWKKDQKRDAKEWKKSQRGDDDNENGDHQNGDFQNGEHQNGNYQNDDHQDDNRVYRGDDYSYRNSSAVARGNGHGKDNGKGKHKDKN